MPLFCVVCRWFGKSSDLTVILDNGQKKYYCPRCGADFQVIVPSLVLWK